MQEKLEKSPFLLHNSKKCTFSPGILNFFYDNQQKFDLKISFKIEHLCTEKDKFLAIILTTYTICSDPTTYLHTFTGFLIK